MEKLSFNHVGEQDKGVIYLLLNNKQIGKITYKNISENIISANHTDVDYEHNGKGYAKKLVEELVDFARKNSLKIKPVCPYVVAVFKRNKEFTDVYI